MNVNKSNQERNTDVQTSDQSAEDQVSEQINISSNDQPKCSCQSKIKQFNIDKDLQNAEIIKLNQKINAYEELLLQLIKSVNIIVKSLDTAVCKTGKIIENVKKRARHRI